MIEIKHTQKLVKTSYDSSDVVLLLKDLTPFMHELSTEDREKLIQSGTHYSEMLPEEKAPSPEYEALYEKALHNKRSEIALGIAKISEMMFAEATGGFSKSSENTDAKPVIVSLARAGIPVGILMKRYLKQRYNIDCPHYAISIIRDKGIDVNAMEYIYSNEIVVNKNKVSNIYFVDGWTGKGVIKKQLDEAVDQLIGVDTKWSDLRKELFVLSDPANITEYCGTHEDYLLPSACLNSTVSGLTSRTILNSYVDVKAGDFHGAVYFKKFETIDKSNEFLDIVSSEFKDLDSFSYDLISLDNWNGMSIVNNICSDLNIADYKKVKPGIGETTRVLLRRIPWRVLINEDVSDDDPDIQHILVLCKEKHIETMRYKLGHYKVCGIIKELSADA